MTSQSETMTSQYDDVTPHPWQIRVTRILDPSNFYAQFSQDFLFEHFLLMEADLQTYCTDMEHAPVSHLQDGMTVLAFSTSLDKWLRAEVIYCDNEGEEADLLYIDYGQSEVRSWDLIIASFDPRFLDLPRMAYLCSLAEVRPLAKSWVIRAVTYFSSLVSDVTASGDVIVMDGIGPLLTRIFVQHDGVERSVAELMIEEELALPANLPLTPTKSQSPAPVTSAYYSPKLKTDFETLFKESSKSSDDSGGEKPLKTWQIDPSDHSQMLGDLKMMFGDELVDKILADGKGDDPGKEVPHDDNGLTLEQQIRKMRNKRHVGSVSPKPKSRDRGDVTRDRSDVTRSRERRDVAGKSRDPSDVKKPRERHDVSSSPHNRRKEHLKSKRGRSPPRLKTLPFHKRDRDPRDPPKRELRGADKDDKISTVICDLSEIVAGSKENAVARALDHLLHCFHCYILDVNEFMNPEELCNDLKSFLDRAVRFPQLRDRFIRLVSHVQNHDAFTAAITFALPRVISDHTQSVARTEPLCSVLTSLYESATWWPSESRLATHALILDAVEGWLLFSTQPEDCPESDSSPVRVTGFLACVELVLPSVGRHANHHYLRKVDQLVNVMRDIVLSADLDRADRETVLDLLIAHGRDWRDEDDVRGDVTSDGDGDDVTERRPVTPRKQSHGRNGDAVPECCPQTSTSPHRTDRSPATDVTLPDVVRPVTSGREVTSSTSDEEYVDVRLMLMELNLSQYIGEMKQCGITDEVISNPDVDLGSLMTDFQLPAVVAKRVLLHLGRDLPPWLYDQISREKEEMNSKEQWEKEEAQEQPFSRPDWSKYRTNRTPPPRPDHVTQLTDFLQPKTFFPTSDIQVKVIEQGQGQEEEVPLNDSDTFPPLKSVELFAPPKVTRVTETTDDKTEIKSGNLKADQLRIRDVAREIIASSPSYSSAAKANSVDSDAHRKSSRNADNDEDWRRKDSPDKNARVSKSPDPPVPVEADRPDHLEFADPERTDYPLTTPERVNLVNLCHNTGALDFKFQDEEEENKTNSECAGVAGLNAVVDLFCEPVKSSPVTRGTRSPRPSSAGSKTDPDWFDVEIVEKPALKSENEQKSKLLDDSRGSTRTYWTDLVEASPAKNAENSVDNPTTEENRESNDSVDSEDDVKVIIDAYESQRLAAEATLEEKRLLAEERQRKIEKFLNPKPQAETLFKGFKHMICTNCGSKDHGFDHCPTEKKIIFY